MTSARQIKSSIKRLHRHSEKLLTKHHPHVTEFFANKGLPPGKIRDHATRLLTSGALASALLISAPQVQYLDQVSTHLVSALPSSETADKFTWGLKANIPDQIKPLTHEQETGLSNLFFHYLGLKAYPELEGNRLNHSFGLIGAEQHLPRFPGDTINQHDSFQQSGITPGLGAWGYFAPSKMALTPDLMLKEKYYVAVQTLYLSDWYSRLNYLRDWYKYRKVLVVNPNNGRVVVAVVADSGPAKFTGKHFGGSPEVMVDLGLDKGPRKGAVILFFVDDPKNEVPLGPININKI